MGGTGLYWAVLDCPGLQRAVLGCIRLYWAVLGCKGCTEVSDIWRAAILYNMQNMQGIEVCKICKIVVVSNIWRAAVFLSTITTTSTPIP